MKELTLSLLLWLGAPDFPPPNVFVWTVEDIRTLPGVDPHALAAYNCGLVSVFLPTGFDPESPAQRSMLLHELVHHGQCLEGRFRFLPGNRDKLEAEAYAAQLRYLHEHGIGRDVRIEDWLLEIGIER